MSQRQSRAQWIEARFGGTLRKPSEIDPQITELVDIDFSCTVGQNESLDLEGKIDCALLPSVLYRRNVGVLVAYASSVTLCLKVGKRFARK